MIAVPCQQRSAAWFLARCGVVTGSRVDAVVARGRYGTEATTRALYRKAIIHEILSGVPAAPTFTPSAAMRLGIALEPAARAAYAARVGRPVHTVGFVRHDTLRAGCSLDGYLGTLDAIEGIVELKAGRVTYGKTVAQWRVPAAYRAQVRQALWITGAPWCDFVCYVPTLPLVVVRVERASEALLIEAHECAVRQFLTEVEAAVAVVAEAQAAEAAKRAAVEAAHAAVARVPADLRRYVARGAGDVAVAA